MIDCDDIQRAVGGLLRKNGFSVVALEVQDGAKKPFCCVEVFPSESERTAHFIVEDTFSVNIAYYPKTETNEELLRAAKIIKHAVLYTPLDIDERCVETFNVKFDRVDTVLTAATDYTVEQLYDTGDESDGEIADLELKFKNNYIRRPENANKRRKL